MVPLASGWISALGSVADIAAATSAVAAASGSAALPTTKFQAAKDRIGAVCPL